ncbi:MAG TPA: hypothetical protein VHM30_12610, partial [Gemmatimonadaceae bacterium]|nr:hypothetical protein [Gemmatimonadaceae bacterium]
MTRFLTLAAVATLCTAAPLGAQLAASANVPSIPPARHFSHWGEIERSYDDDENSTSIALTLPFDDKQRGAFIRHGSARAVSLSAGFVFPGKEMGAYPEIVTLMLKVTRPTDAALRGDRAGASDISFTIDGAKPLIVPAPVVGRNGTDMVGGRPRSVEDTYVVVLTLWQFLRV